MDAREGMYMITKIESGSVVERRKSKTMRRPSKRRNRVRGNSSEKKMEGNRQYAILQLTRSFNCNLQPGDVWLTLKLDEEHMTCCGGTFEGVKKEAKKFVDRLCYRMKKAGVVCKWYLAPSEIDGETGELVRPHAHLVMTGQGFRMENGVLFLRDERVDDIWGQGSVDVQFVRHQKDYYPLAKYIINQSRGVPDEKKYTCSRNLKKPKITRTVVFSGAQLRVPAGATVLPGTRYDPEAGQDFVRYIPADRRERAVRKVGGRRELARAQAGDAGEEADGT